MIQYEFTCKAVSFSAQGINCHKGQRILVNEGDVARLRVLRNHPGAFTEKSREVSDNATGAKPTPAPPGGAGNGSAAGNDGGEPPAPGEGSDEVTLESLVTPEQLANLQEAGYPSLLEIATAAPEDLKKVPKIGEATIKKLLSAAGNDGGE